VVEAPERLMAEREDQRREVVRCLDLVLESLKRGRTVRLRFSHTIRLYPAGTLMFVSNILRYAHRFPGRILVSYPKDQIVEELLQHIGFLQQFGLAPRCTVSAENVKHWHFVSGQKAEVGQLEGLVRAYMGHLPDNPNADLYGCLCEAILNVSYHAYPADKTPEPGAPHWWMFAQQKDDTLLVAVYDTGIGIPNSLRQRPNFLEQLGTNVGLDSQRMDHKLLTKAVSSARSSTGKVNQGKGLPEMLSFARGAEGGTFYALSGHGEFRYDAERGGAKSKHSHAGLKGTLLSWRLPLRPGADVAREEVANGT